MKNKSIILLYTQLYDQLKINVIKNKKICKENTKIICMAFVYIFVAIMLSLYSFSLGYGLGYIGAARVIPACALSITAMVTLVLTMIKANGVLFAYSDYEMLMALPVKTSSIIISRFANMYILNILFSLVVMIPMGAAYAIYQKPSGLFYFLWVIGIFVGSLIPTTVATIIGVIIIIISSRCKHSSVVSTVLSFALIFSVAGLIGQFGSSNKINNIDLSNLKNIVGIISKSINRVYPLSSLFAKGINDYNSIYFLMFVGISILWYYLFIWILSKVYKKLNTGLMTYRKKSNFKLSSIKINTPIMALYRKEIKRFFSSTIYVINIGMGAVMLIVSTLVCFFTGPEKIENIIGVNGVPDIVVRILPFAMSTLIAMTCTTCVALSLEGKNLWILKSSPVKLITIFNSKILVNLTLLFPASIICSVLLRLRFNMKIIDTVCLFVIPIIYCFFTAVWGMFINIKMPNYQWKSEISVIKQGMASMIGMLGGALFALIPVIFVFKFRYFDYHIIEIVISSMIATLTICLYKAICRIKSI